MGKMETARKVAEERLGAILDTIDNVVWSISAKNYETLYLNPAAEQVYGRPAIDFYDNPKLFHSIVHPDDRALLEGILPELIEKGSMTLQYRIVRPDGEIRWLDDTVAIARDSNGKLERFDGVATDITERVITQQRLSSILQSIDNVVWSICAKTYETLYLNPAAEQVYGRTASAFYNDPELFLNIVHPDDRSLLEEVLPELVEKGAMTLQYRIVRPDGDIRWLEDRVTVGGSSKLEPERFDGVATDITDRKQHESQLSYLANHDALTDLPNRNLLDDRILQAIAQAQRGGHKFGLLLLDLDRFKNINDGYGHIFGDQLLLTVASQLNKSVRDSDTVARLGGDEFVILLSPLETHEEIYPVVRRLLNIFSLPFTIEGTDLYTTTSIGIAVFPEDGINTEDLLKNADIAMYRAKEMGRNGFQFFETDMSADATERLELENALRGAIEREEFVLYYQPQTEIKSNKVTSVEALIRWQHPTQGLLAPDKFLKIAEDTGLIIPIGAWVLKTACTQAKKWQDTGLSNHCISVNISAKQFWEGQLVKTVKRVLQETGISPENLELEITETVFLRDINETIRTIHELRDMGIIVSMDDFGTGYSSLTYLRLLPIEKLKIDGSFIQDMSKTGRSSILLTQIIQLAHAMNLEVVAEGVETEEEYDFLVANQCDVAQGFYLHKPISSQELEKLLKIKN